MTAKQLAKIVVSLALLAWLLSRQPLAEIQAALRQPMWGWLAVALAVYGLSAIGGALQWGWLLHAAGLGTRMRVCVRLYLVGLFFNNFLPANVGGDIYKVVDLGRREQDAAKVFAATLLDRLLGLSALTMVAVVAVAVAVGAGIPLPPVTWLLGGVLLVLGGAVAALLSRRLGTRLPGWLRRLRMPTLAEQLAMVVADFQAFRRRPRLLARLFAYSLVVQALRIVTHLAVAWGLHLSLAGAQVLQLFVLVPMLAISLTLPVTINGIGLRETVSAYLLPWSGLEPRAVVAMEMMAFLVMVAFSLVGGVVFWSRRPAGTDATVRG